MANYSGIIKIDLSWTNLKITASFKSIPIQYDATSSAYDIFCTDGNITYTTTIFRGPVPDTVNFNQTQNDIDKANFEANYKDVTTNKPAFPAVSQDGYSTTTTNPTLIAASDGYLIRTVKSDTTGRLTVVGSGTAGVPLGGVLTIQGISGGQPLSVSGSVTSTEASVGSTSSTPPASATYIGGSVTTAAPSYTTGQLNALSLTTTGLLRIDGSGVTQPISGTVTANIGTTNGLALDTTLAKLTIAQSTALGSNTQAMVGGSVTTSSPTYTTGNINPLSLTTAGSLRVDGSETTQPVSGTVTSNIGTTNGLALDATLAKLTITQSTALGSNTQAMVGGSVTTAAPTYTTGNINPLSLTTSGALRVDGSGVTQPISGTVTSNIGTTNGLALDATLSAMSLVDNAAFTDGTTRVQPAGYIFDEVVGTALTENDAAAARIDSKRAQIGVIEDGTTRGTRNTIKTASTAAATTDTSLVVALSPNSQTPLNSDISTSGTVVANGGTVTTSLNGCAGITITVTGTWVGTLAFEASGNGIDYFSVNGNNAGVGTLQTSTTANGFWRTNVGAYKNFRLRATAWTSGTATIDMLSGSGLNTLRIFQTNAASLLGQMQVTDGTNVAAVKAASTAAVVGDPALVVTISPNSAKAGITGIVKPLYGTSNQTMTITLASLTNTSARASTAVDNTTSLYEDVNIFVKVTTAAAGVSATGYVNIYAYATVDGGTTYPEAITGTDAGITLTAPPNLVLIGQINANTNGATKLFGPISFCRNAGFDRLPARWGIVITNQTGATFNATAGNFAVTYQGVNGNLV